MLDKQQAAAAVDVLMQQARQARDDRSGRPKVLPRLLRSAVLRELPLNEQLALHDEAKLDVMRQPAYYGLLLGWIALCIQGWLVMGGPNHGPALQATAAAAGGAHLIRAFFLRAQMHRIAREMRAATAYFSRG